METNKHIDQETKKIRGVGLFVFFLTALQLARVKIGPLPLYFVEVILCILIFRAPKTQVSFRSKNSRRILTVSKIFFFCVILGEIRGAVSYNFVSPAIYQIFRYGLGIYLIIYLPRIVRNKHQFSVILKAAVLGMLVTSSLSIFSSLPPTRPIVMTVFSIKILNPSGSKGLETYTAVRGTDHGIRGISLIGPATFTGAYLCTLWPLGILAHRRLTLERKFKQFALLACIFVPIGSMLTYSRSSWLGISIIICLIGVLGFSGNRRIIIILLTITLTILSQIGLNSSFLYMERMEKRGATAFVDPMAHGDVRERYLSYTQPFDHLLNNPSWFIAGAGSAGDKMAERGVVSKLIYNQEKLATHSAIAWSYYGYGVIGSICHILLILLTIELIRSNIYSSRRIDIEEIQSWQLFLAAWLGGILPWWLFGHGIVSSARGSMFFFFMIALFLTYDNLQENANNTMNA